MTSVLPSVRTPADAGGRSTAFPAQLADHVTTLSHVMNVLGLAIDGASDDCRQDQADSVRWLSDLARDVTEGVHAIVHGVPPRWQILSELGQLRSDAGGDA